MRFGRTELMVSKLALGGIPLMRLPKEDGVAIVREALDLGINFIDTARAYTDSEEKIGEAIRGIPREELVLSSKSIAQTPAELSDHLDTSLSLLGVDYVDIFHLHSISSQERYDNAFKEGGNLEWLQEQVKLGKVRFPAFSSHTVDLALKIMQTNQFDVVQLPLNFIDLEAEKAVGLARELDMGFISMKPMGGGRIDKAEPAFHYLMQYDNIVPDPGIESLEQIREIVAIVEAGERLNEADEAYIVKLRAETGATWCHRCDYCQPCSQGILISSALIVESTFGRFNSQGAHWLVDGAVAAARSCTQCGDCLPRCPYHLDIPTLLKENIAVYDRIVKEESVA